MPATLGKGSDKGEATRGPDKVSGEVKVAPMVRAELRDLEVALLEASKTNPRKVFSKEGLDELAASIRVHGIVQPLIVRALIDKGGATKGPDKVGEARYEVVAGERRLRAAHLAGLKAAPCLIREMTDGDVLEVQYIENLQRADLTALEEAEGFKRLIDAKRYTAESLAVKLGMSRGHVFNRLRLARSSEVVKKAVAGGMPATLGNLVCQLPTPKLQEEALRELKDMDENWVSFRTAQQVLQQTHMRDIKGEHFDAADAQLFAKAGACTVCPKRSGNMPESMAGNGNVCTDVECYEEKCKLAAVAREGEKAKELVRVLDEFKGKGFKTLGPESARQLFVHEDVLPYQSEYVKLNDLCGEDKRGRTYKELLGEDKGSVVVAVGRHDKAVKLLVKADLPRLLKAAGHKFIEEQEVARKNEAARINASRAKSGEELAAEAKKREAEVERLRKEEASLAWREKFAMGLLVAGLEKPLKDEGLVWRLLAEEFIHGSDASAIFWRRNLDGNAGVAQLTKGMKVGQARGFMLEAFICDYDGYDTEKCEALAEAAGLDWGKLMKAGKVAYAEHEKAEEAKNREERGDHPVGKMSATARAKLAAAARARWAKAKDGEIKQKQTKETKGKKTK